MNIEEAIEILSDDVVGYAKGHEKYEEAVKTLLTAYEKEKEKNKELESDKEQLKYEIDCLKNDIKNMYCAVITIIEDNFDLSREEVIQILGEE